jgi:hypothetical protein
MIIRIKVYFKKTYCMMAGLGHISNAKLLKVTLLGKTIINKTPIAALNFII